MNFIKPSAVSLRFLDLTALRVFNGNVLMISEFPPSWLVLQVLVEVWLLPFTTMVT